MNETPDEWNARRNSVYNSRKWGALFPEYNHLVAVVRFSEAVDPQGRSVPNNYVVTAWAVFRYSSSFPVTGLADLPLAERDLVLEVMGCEPVRHWLDISTVEQLPDSPFAVTHLEPLPGELARLVA